MYSSTALWGFGLISLLFLSNCYDVENHLKIDEDRVWNDISEKVFTIAPTDSFSREKRQTLLPSEADLLGKVLSSWGLSINQTTLYVATSGRVTRLDVTRQVKVIPPGLPSELFQLTYLSALILQGNQLVGSIPSAIGSLTRLQGVNFEDNSFSGSLPVEVFQLPVLVQFLMKSNALTGSLSPAVGSSPRLQALRLATNSLTGIIPTEIGLSKTLVALDIGTNSFSGQLPSELGNLKAMNTLLVDSTLVSGTIPKEFQNLVSLAAFRISVTSISGDLYPLRNSIQMQALATYNTQIVGPIPTELGLWKRVQYLMMYSSQINGTIPSELGSCTSLIDLELQQNRLVGTLPNELANLTRLIQLRVDTNQLEGTLSTGLGNLTAMQYLYLNINNFSGSIPSELGLLRNCTRLRLSENSFPPARFPSELGNLALLEDLTFPASYSVPTELGLLTSLTTLTLGVLGKANPLLSGTIPTVLGNLKKLKTLDGLSGSSLTGTLPSEIGNMRSLRGLDLSFIYGIAGTLPTELGNLESLSTGLNLQSNLFSGTIPSQLGNLDLATKINLAENSLSGTVPKEMYDLPLLSILRLHGNQLDGTIPTTISKLRSLTEFDIGGNHFSGTIPSEIGSCIAMSQLNIFSNSIEGTIPTEIGKVPLNNIVFRGCFLSGTIPTTLPVSLQVLDLSSNSLTGGLTALCRLTALQGLYLQANYLNGTIPSCFQYIANLEELNLNENQMVGSIPNDLAKLSKLSIVKLRGNNFQLSFGWLARGFCISLSIDLSRNNIQDLASRQVALGSDSGGMSGCSAQQILDLSENNLTTSFLRTLLGSATQWTDIDLSYNRLAGELTAPILPLKSLRGLRLGHNSLSGTLPASFITQIPQMETLILTNNKFSGVIPADFWKSSLILFDVSSNNFSGTIESFSSSRIQREIILSSNMFTGNVSNSIFADPSDQFHLQFNSLSCLGLPLWCAGSPLNTSGTYQCYPCVSPCGDGLVWGTEECDDANTQDGDGCDSSCKIENRHSCSQPTDPQVKFVQPRPTHCSKNFPYDIVLPAILVPIGVICLILIFTFFVRRKLQQQRNSIKKLLKMLDSSVILNESDLELKQVIGEGNFGKVHMGVFNKTTRVAVKEVKHDEDQEQIESLLTEARLMSSIPPHPNIVQFIGVCKSVEKKSFYIVTQFVPNNNLQKFVYYNKVPVPEKIELLIGVSAGMYHLSKYSITHNDLAARNILVEETVVRDATSNPRMSLVAKVADFGLAISRRANKGRKTTTTTSKVSLPVRWAAPEVLQDVNKLSIKSDVWSYGIVVWEIMSNCKRAPYPGLSNPEVIDFVIKDKGMMASPPETPDKLYELMCRCWKFDPESRPGFDSIYGELTEYFGSFATKDLSFLSDPLSLTGTTNTNTTSSNTFGSPLNTVDIHSAVSINAPTESIGDEHDEVYQGYAAAYENYGSGADDKKKKK